MISQDEITCYATDDMSIIALLKQAGSIVLTRQRVLAARREDRWSLTWGPELVIWTNMNVIKIDDLEDIITWLALEGQQAGIFLKYFGLEEQV